MTERTRLIINYKNGNTLTELVHYVHYADGAIFYAEDSKIENCITIPTRTSLEYVESYDVERVMCNGWEVVG